MLQKCYLNDLRILDTETFVWSRLRVSGTPPNPRYGHTASISGPDIVFFGGWTHESGKRLDKRDSGNTEYFTILNTNTMSWDMAQYKGKAPLCRYGHTVTSIGPHLLIFGTLPPLFLPSGGWEYSRATNEVVVLRDLNLTNDPNKVQ
jgi:Rab9 effector protein with kelch motifs